MKLALVLLGLIIVTAVFGAARYVEVVFDGEPTWEACIEGLHYAVQAITTVGYGSWEPAKSMAWKARTDEAQRELQIYQLKKFSLGLMGVGVLSFGALIAVVSDILLHL